MERPKGGPRKAHIVLGLLGIVVLVFVLLLAGYFLTSFAYEFVGEPPEILRHLLTALTAIVIGVLLRLVLNYIEKRTGRFDQRRGLYHRLVDALEQISQGNYDVMLDYDESGIYQDLPDVVNEMAQRLGSAESMRQDFIANVSHEIQSPITSIGGFASLLKSDTLTNEQRVNYATIIEDESRRLSSLSENLLKLSALEAESALVVSEFRLDRQLESIAVTMEPQWGKKNLIVEADLNVIDMMGDEALLSQVWINLLHNAIKFTPPEGRISITSTLKGDTVQVKISDTGIGIAPEDQLHLFERFYKADKARDRSTSGNGLGLALVKRIVALHGGHITVESTLESGSTFLVVIPQKV